MLTKLTKAQQAIEDKIMANLTPLQRFKMGSQTAALIYAIQKGELPLPNVEKIATWEAQRRSGSQQADRPTSAASSSLASSPPSSPIPDLDVTPKASDNNNNIAVPGTLWNDALMKIAEPVGKTSKKTAKTRKKKNLGKPETEVRNRELACGGGSAIKPKLTSATTVVKKAMSVIDTPSEKQVIVVKTSESVAVPDPTSSMTTVVKSTKLPSMAIPEEVPVAQETEDASPPKMVRKTKSVRRSQSSPPPSVKESEVVVVVEPEIVQEVTQPPPPEDDSQPRRSKRSLTIDISAKKMSNVVDSALASPLVRRSRLTAEIEPPKVEQQQQVSEKKRSLRSSNKAVDEQLPPPPPPVEPEPEPDLDLDGSEFEEEIDKVSSSSSGEETETEDNNQRKTPLRDEKTTEIATQPPENKSTRTRPVNKATRAEAQMAGPEADQQQQQQKQDGPSRTRVKNKANQAESRNAGPEETGDDFSIPSASALVEAEKLMQNFGKNSGKNNNNGANNAAKSGKTYGNAPNSAQKQQIPRLGTPMKATTSKKPTQIAVPTINSTTATKVFRVEGMTPQQKGPITQALLAANTTAPTITTIPVPFGSGGAPSKPKLPQPAAAKNPSRPNSPIALNKMPIASGLAGAVALGKVVPPEIQPPTVKKYDNLVTNVMSFMPQAHGLQSAATKAPVSSNTTTGTSSKLASSTSASQLQQQKAAAVAMGTKVKANESSKIAAPANKVATSTKILPASGTSTSKLPLPSAVPKPVPAAHVIVQQMPAPKPQPVVAAVSGATNKPQQQHTPQGFYSEENVFNSTYSKGLDATMAAFDITRFDETYQDYPIDDVRPCGDDDDDEEEDLKPIPEWAKPARLNARIAKQNQLDTRIRKRLDMDEDLVNTDGIDEALVNPDRPARIRPRTSSQHWTTPPLLKSKQQDEK